MRHAVRNAAAENVQMEDVQLLAQIMIGIHTCFARIPLSLAVGEIMCPVLKGCGSVEAV